MLDGGGTPQDCPGAVKPVRGVAWGVGSEMSGVPKTDSKTRRLRGWRSWVVILDVHYRVGVVSGTLGQNFIIVSRIVVELGGDMSEGRCRWITDSVMLREIT